MSVPVLAIAVPAAFYLYTPHFPSCISLPSLSHYTIIRIIIYVCHSVASGSPRSDSDSTVHRQEKDSQREDGHTRANGIARESGTTGRRHYNISNTDAMTGHYLFNFPEATHFVGPWGYKKTRNRLTAPSYPYDRELVNIPGLETADDK